MQERECLPAVWELDVREIVMLARETGMPLHTLACLTEAQALDAASVAAHYEEMKQTNWRTLHFLRDDFYVAFSRYAEEVDILTTGSVARLENRVAFPNQPVPLDIILIGENTEALEEVRGTLLAADAHRALPPIDPHIEVINVARAAPLSAYEGNAHSIWPNRVIDGFRLLGEGTQLARAKARILSEWDSDREVCKSTFVTLQQFVKACRDGMYAGRKQFDLEEGAVFFDPVNRVCGLKFGPLRALQLFNFAHHMFIGHSGFGHVFEGEMLRRLEYFFPDSGAAVAAYKQALCVYHWQQLRASSDLDATVLLSSEKMLEMTMPIAEFIERNGKKIGWEK